MRLADQQAIGGSIHVVQKVLGDVLSSQPLSVRNASSSALRKLSVGLGPLCPMRHRLVSEQRKYTMGNNEPCGPG
jgi:hypothetical protein